jgi:hypothetical protein
MQVKVNVPAHTMHMAQGVVGIVTSMGKRPDKRAMHYYNGSPHLLMELGR